MEEHSHSVEESLNTLRMLVLQECEDGVFRQVLLDSSKYKAVGDIVSEKVESDIPMREGYEMRYTPMRSDWTTNADTFLGLSDFYSKEEIKKLDSDEIES